MRILIGTPIHVCKDYAMERWLENVAKLQLESPVDLLMVDNSPGLDYVEKVQGYCLKYGITNYKIGHLAVDPALSADRKVEMSQEIIRQEILSQDYDAWFSWECDQLIPANALDQLTRMMKTGNIMMVNHNGWVRGHPDKINTNFGVSLIKRECLEKYSFLLQFGTGPDMPDHWEPGEVWFKKQVLRGGGSCIEVEGIINPIYHLDN